MFCLFFFLSQLFGETCNVTLHSYMIMAALYGRNRLVRTLAEKQHFEEQLSAFDKFAWYAVDVSHFPSDLRSKFVQTTIDDETNAFLDYCRDVSDSLCLQIFYDLASAILQFFYTKTCINGFLGRGVMFIFSSAHLSALFSGIFTDNFLNNSNVNLNSINLNLNYENKKNRGAILDLGAGDGTITDKFRPYFNDIYVTEASTMMKRRLKNRGFYLLPIEDWWRTDDVRFRLISCLNLIDRHPKPLTLLTQIREKAKRDGALILLAVVLPWNQYVEYEERNSTGKNRPVEYLEFKGRNFEEQIVEMKEKILDVVGLRIVRWTRLPYLCEGDLNRSVYWLDDAIFLLEPVEN